MMSFHHQTDANICQISENQWREVTSCAKVSIQLVRLKSEEALRAKSLRHNVCCSDPFSDLLFEQVSEQVNSN